MAVHRIGLVTAVLLVLIGLVFILLVGPLGLILLILAVVLFWYAFGPGSRGSVIITTP